MVGAREGMFAGAKTPATLDELSPSLIRDTSKCILCGRCVSRCQAAHGNGILGFENRGFKPSLPLHSIVHLANLHVYFVDNALPSVQPVL